MATTVQARLDKRSLEALQRLQARRGATASQIIRDSLIQADREAPAEAPPKFLGIGSFDSGLGDLATNKKYMEDFGLTRQQRLERAKALETAEQAS
jgi:hypothetical protein